jgi:exodeoxyribonuclease VII small subunit
MADFAKELTELEGAVERLESGELGLDEGLKAFENGLKHYKKCLEIIDTAEQKVQKLVQTGTGEKLVDF